MRFMEVGMPVLSDTVSESVTVSEAEAEASLRMIERALLHPLLLEVRRALLHDTAVAYGRAIEAWLWQDAPLFGEGLDAWLLSSKGEGERAGMGTGRTRGLAHETPEFRLERTESTAQRELERDWNP